MKTITIEKDDMSTLIKTLAKAKEYEIKAKALKEDITSKYLETETETVVLTDGKHFFTVSATSKTDLETLTKKDKENLASLEKQVKEIKAKAKKIFGSWSFRGQKRKASDLKKSLAKLNKLSIQKKKER